MFRGRAKGAGALDDPVEQLGGVGVDLHATGRRIRLVLADLQLFDREIAAQVHDHVHHLGQHHRVDDVTLEHEPCAVPSLGHARTPAAALI